MNPSLVISPGDDGQALVFCHGCADGKVWDRLMAWLRDEGVTPTAGKPKGQRSKSSRAQSSRDNYVNTRGHYVTRYQYRDTAGRLIADHHRYSDKSFPWYRNESPDGSTPLMRLGLGDVTLPCLYRLDEIGERAKEIGEVIVVEGEKDADRLWELGYAATCTPHGSMWPVDGVVEFIAGLDQPVRVIRDKDDKGYAWAAGLHRELTDAGVEVHVYETPVDGKGADVSDHLDAGLEIPDLVLIPPEDENGVDDNAGNDVDDNSDDDGTELLPPPTEPMVVARVVVHDLYRDGLLTLQFWRGDWMRWRDTRWHEVEASEIRSWLYRQLENAVYETKLGPRPWAPTRHKIANVLEAVAAITHLRASVNPPAWLRDGPAPAGEIVACANGLLHAGTRELHKLTPAFFNVVSVPFAYSADAREPTKWLAFLDQLWPGDPESVAALQEWFGYVLSGRTDLHKILLLIGPRRAGKGTIARILIAMIGKGHVAGPTLASLGTNFGLWPLLGKPLAIVSDARLGGANTGVVVERLLSISGEDALTVDRKFREPWTGQLPTRLMVVSNELPRFGDASGAIATRFVMLTLRESFLGRENTRLTDELLTELPEILSWSLDGLDRLTSQGRLSTPASSEDAVGALQDLVSPMSAFVRDRCETGVGLHIPVDSLFDVWKQWCVENEQRVGSVQTFGQKLMAVVPVLRRTRPEADDGTRYRAYEGITVRAHSGYDRGHARTEGMANRY